MNPQKTNSFLAVLTLLFLNFSLHAATITWIGPNNGHWNVAANWSPAVVPSISDDVVINNGTTVIVWITATENAQSVLITAKSTLLVQGSLFISSSPSDAITIGYYISGANSLLKNWGGMQTSLPGGLSAQKMVIQSPQSPVSGLINYSSSNIVLK